MFKKPKHTTFHYQPRFSEKNRDDLRSKTNENDADFVAKWRRSKGFKPRKRRGMSLSISILVLVLLLICMYLLEKQYM